MFQNFISNVLLHNRPITPTLNAFAKYTTSKISNSNYTASQKPSNHFCNRIGANIYPEKRTLFTSFPLSKDDGKDKSKDSTSEKTPGSSTGSPPETPPWPPYGPCPSCCDPNSNEKCDLPPPPPRNPNPFYNYPPPYIRTPPPPWCTSQTQVSPICPASTTLPYPPEGTLDDVVVPKDPNLEQPNEAHKKEYVLDKKYDFDVFSEMTDVLNSGENSEEYFEELKEYFEPKYKNLVYFSYNGSSYYDMGVNLQKFYCFPKGKADVTKNDSDIE